jgi:hypothetical protein
MKLCCDGTSLRIQDKWHCAGMLWLVPHVDSLLRLWLPLWDFLSITKSLVQHIHWLGIPKHDSHEICSAPISSS